MSAQGTMPGLSRPETAMADGGFRISFSFGDFPELVHQLRREVVSVLEERAAAAFHPEVRRELLKIAAEFDAGFRLDEDWEEDLDGP